MTDAEDSERRQSEFKEKTENFVKNLELDETLGQLLVAEGFSSIDDIKDTTAAVSYTHLTLPTILLV